MSGPAASSTTAKSTWELNNNVQDVNNLDSMYSYDPEKQKEINRAKPWRSDPHWFKKVKVSATALIKMVMHARSGGQYEVMGLMQGKLDGDTFIVLDAFPLPVQGTETRVNAGNEGTEFAVQYMEGSNAVGRKENVVGWYHSHPGYGCWLSGIDVSTQMTNQAFQDPFLSVVIDPNRTVSAGRVEIGAFRTYPEGYTPPTAAASEYQSIPLNKIEDFGVHAARYYSLEVSHFKSSLDTKLLDLLWNKYWVMTLSQSPLVSNRAYTTSQISDLTSKLAKTESSLQTRSSIGHMVPEIVRKQNNKEKGAETGESSQTAARKTQPSRGFGGHASDAEASNGEKPLDKAIHDATKVSGECQHGMLSQILKDTVFNCNKASLLSAADAAPQ